MDTSGLRSSLNNKKKKNLHIKTEKPACKVLTSLDFLLIFAGSKGGLDIKHLRPYQAKFNFKNLMFYVKKIQVCRLAGR